MPYECLVRDMYLIRIAVMTLLIFTYLYVICVTNVICGHTSIAIDRRVLNAPRHIDRYICDVSFSIRQCNCIGYCVA